MRIVVALFHNLIKYLITTKKMPTFNKTLQGVVRITGNGDYDFSLPGLPINSTVQNVLSNVVLEEVFIIIEQGLNQVNINLPKISDFNNRWNAKIYIINKSDIENITDYFNLNSYNTEDYTDWLNQSGTTQISLVNTKATCFVHIVDNNYWLVK